MNPKAKTLIQKQGFLDPDRLLQAHDEIHLWAFNNMTPVLRSLSARENKFEILHKEMEYPIIQSSPTYKSIVGFVDLYAHGIMTDTLNEERRGFEVYIEIKSRIPSCGDLIRQIQFYKKFQVHGKIWIVISPDDRFKDILKQQGIYFYKPPGQDKKLQLFA